VAAKSTVTPPAVPPVRLTVIVAEPAASVIENVGDASLTVPPTSTSPMVKTALLSGASAVDAGLLSNSSTVCAPFTCLSARSGTVKVPLVTPGPKVKVPDVGL
jgi:hypothetical protein